MISRRHTLQGGLATAGIAAVTSPGILKAQSKGPTKVRYAEVVRSILYAPKYVAISNGIFTKHGLDVTMTTAQGGDKLMPLLLSGSADIGLLGPEVPIYVLNSDSPVKTRIFCGLTVTDGFMLMGREKVAKFEWSMLKGKEILGFRPGSTPLLYLEAALRKNGIDPLKDVKLNNNVAIPARVGSWLAGQNQFGIFTEPDPSQLEIDGKAHFCASIGETVGPADYTVFCATEKFIKENPATVQAWTDAIVEAMRWTHSAPIPDLVKALQPFFTGVSEKAIQGACERYRRLGMWKKTAVIDEAPIEKFQDILVDGRVLEKAKRVKFADLITNEFARKAK